MTQDRIEININELSEEQKELAECIGMEAYVKLVKNYGGTYIYICKEDTICKSERNRKIKDEFDGWNYRELALKYKLSERTVRDIVSEEIQKIKNTPPEGQMSWYNMDGENY